METEFNFVGQAAPKKGNGVQKTKVDLEFTKAESVDNDVNVAKTE